MPTLFFFFKMVLTKQQKAVCVVEHAKTSSIITVHHNFCGHFGVDKYDKNSIKHTQLLETGCLCRSKSTIIFGAGSG